MSAVAARMNAPAGRLALRILPVAGIAAAIALVASPLPVLRVAANRLVVGTPVEAAAALGGRGWAVAGLCLIAGVLLPGGGRRRHAAVAALAAACAALLLFADALGVAASGLVAGQPPATRARLAAGAWTGLLLLAGLVAVSTGATRIRGIGWLTLAGLAAAFGMMARLGSFDGLSLAVEYRARSSSVHAALVEHIALAGAAVALAASACTLLYAWRPARGAVDMAVNGLQVVPAVALLGALVALTTGMLAAVPALRAAGLSALGPGPAIVAVAAYLLLPLWRGLHAALRAPDPATLDAAAAIGLTRGQILTRIRLPLGAPILVGAFRVASVQGIGLATLGALVGAGGLGGIVFDGMAQFAPDLILIGAIPVIALSLAAERSLSLVEDRARRRWRG